MEKNANTVFPNDPVKVNPPNGKTASVERGTVLDADPTSDRVKVRFGDGREDWVDRSRVEKT